MTCPPLLRPLLDAADQALRLAVLLVCLCVLTALFGPVPPEDGED